MPSAPADATHEAPVITQVLSPVGEPGWSTLILCLYIFLEPYVFFSWKMFYYVYICICIYIVLKGYINLLSGNKEDP